MDLYEVITKLSGPINPVGETNEDNLRFKNLKEVCRAVEKLLSDIDEVGMNKDRQEFSVQRAGIFADGFLTRMGIEE